MNRALLRPLATLGAALALVLLPACGARAPLSELEPGRASYELDEARAKFTANNTDDGARLRFGIALYDAGQYQEASTTLEPLLQKPSPNRRAVLYHAAAAEQLNNFEVATRGYTQYLTVSGGDSPEVQARLAAIKRRQAQRGAVEAVRREQELNVASFPEASITVTPFRIEAADSSLAPLGYGLADLLLTDLARSGQLQVVERLQVDAILRELSLAAGGRVDQSTAPRVGKLVGARRVVSGTLVSAPRNRATLTAQVTDVQTSAPMGQGVTTETSIGDILAAEKALVFRLFDELRVTLTPAERAQIAEQPTRYLQAFLAYSRGVQNESQGNMEAAEASYTEAIRIDPNFRLAATRRAGVRTPGSRTVRSANAGNRLRGVIDAVNPSPASVLGNIRDRGNDAADRLGQATTTTLIIIVTTTPPQGGISPR